MIVDDGMIATLGRDNSEAVVRAAIWPPRECQCGRMASFIVNRQGKTRCLECDTALFNAWSVDHAQDSPKLAPKT